MKRVILTIVVSLAIGSIIGYYVSDKKSSKEIDNLITFRTMERTHMMLLLADAIHRNDNDDIPNLCFSSCRSV